MENFCDSTPSVPVADPQLEFGRHTQTLPYCEWTPQLEALTIIAVYSNVPSGGHLEPEQVDRLTHELGAADPGKPVIVALHHPPYSIDADHGGSVHMGQALDQAFSSSGRTAEMVMSGHVHDYQRFTRTTGGRQVAYIVTGNGGYHNLHQLARGASPGQELAPGVRFEFGDASQYGFLEADRQRAYDLRRVRRVKPGTMPDGSDAQITAQVETF